MGSVCYRRGEGERSGGLRAGMLSGDPAGTRVHRGFEAGEILMEIVGIFAPSARRRVCGRTANAAGPFPTQLSALASLAHAQEGRRFLNSVVRPISPWPVCPSRGVSSRLLEICPRAASRRYAPYRAADGYRSSAHYSLVHKAAHAYIVNDTQRQEGEQYRRPAVTHQRQRYSGDRHKTDHHAHVD